MESLSLCLSPSSSSSPFFKPSKTLSKPPQNPSQFPISQPKYKVQTFIQTPLKPHIISPILLNFLSTSSSIASEITNPSPQTLEKINLESILTSIDDFFNKYPFFVAGCTFIWLIVIPLAEEYLKKYKYVSALNAFKKLRDDSSAQLLDIRDDKSVGFLGSPNLRMFKKDVVQVGFDESNQDWFLKNVLECFGDPSSTCVCVMDNFDGNSIKVAELLVKNGFKEAYAIKGGISGKNGWREIQQEFFPPSVHVFPKKKGKKPEQKRESNGSANQPDTDQVQAATTEK